QKDPKVEYKRRSYQMFADMRNNIDEDIANRFFREITEHQRFVREQELRAQQIEQMSQAGYQVTQRQQGKGIQVQRDMPKVGRNDPCPCGSGKKYKNCHWRADQGGTMASNGQGQRSGAKKGARRRR